MKNYYDQEQELILAKLRLKSLKEKRELYFNHTQPGGISYDSERVQGGTVNNSFDIYVGNIEEIDKKIKQVEDEIRILEEHLKLMEYELRKMKGTLEKIFVMRYIDGMSVNQICRNTNYSRSQVFRKLQKIRNITKVATKCDY